MSYQRFEAERATGRKRHEVSVERKRRIGGGHFGDVYLADVHFQQASQERRRQMIVKEYRPNPAKPGMEHKLAERAIRNHQLAKEAGLKVFPTFRLSAEGNSILMTLADTERWICVGTNEGSDSLREMAGGEFAAKPDDEMERFINQVLDQAQLAKQSALSLDSDMIFMLVDRAERKKMDYVLGDMDMITQWPEEMLQDGGDQELYQANLGAMFASLHIFFIKNIPAPKPYLDLLDKAFAEHGGDRAALARIDATTQPKKRVGNNNAN
jgi:hypothetical protein